MLDTSDELQVYRFHHGIRLLRPNASKTLQKYAGWNTGHSVSSLLQLPFSIYFENTHGTIHKLNENNVQMLGFDSIKQAVGKAYFSRFSPKAAQPILENDRMVLQHEKLKIYEEKVIHDDGISYQSLSIKMPWHGNDNKVVGLFGMCIVSGMNPIADSLSIITEFGLLNVADTSSNFIASEIDQINLSKQQRQCAPYLLSGMTYKEIAKRLQLSPRTIETYVDNMKNKFKCKNKAELISKLARIMRN